MHNSICVSAYVYYRWADGIREDIHNGGVSGLGVARVTVCQYRSLYCRTPSDQGISLRTVRELLRITQTELCDWDYVLLFSMLEIYNETIRDLLNGNNNKLDVRQAVDGNNVPGLTEVKVSVCVWVRDGQYPRVCRSRAWTR